jgi:hypothetical protein
MVQRRADRLIFATAVGLLRPALCILVAVAGKPVYAQSPDGKAQVTSTARLAPDTTPGGDVHRAAAGERFALTITVQDDVAKQVVKWRLLRNGETLSVHQAGKRASTVKTFYRYELKSNTYTYTIRAEDKEGKPLAEDKLTVTVTAALPVVQNGIVVGAAKLYDVRSLTRMVQAVQANLARTQFPDPSALFNALERFQGGVGSTSATAFNILGAPTPSIQTTTGGTTNVTNGTNTQTGTTANNSTNTQTQNTNTSGGQSQANVNTPGAPSTPGSTSTTTTTTTTANGSITTTTNNTTGSNTTAATNNSTTATTNNGQVVNQSSFAPSIPTLPSQTSMFAFQPQFGLGAQDLLGAQTSLEYQLINLRLLLERSLTDRLDVQADGALRQTRPQAVIGLQVSIDPKYTDAVAEVEVSVDGAGASTNTPLSLIGLFPQDKTYNVATISRNANSFGIGAVIQQVIGVGASAGNTRETLYLVRDSDTVALERFALNDHGRHRSDQPSSETWNPYGTQHTRPPADPTIQPGALSFAWQFRPVLGRRMVEPGVRQVFALVSLPSAATDAAWSGNVHVKTRWRRYDIKSNRVGDYLDDGDNDQGVQGIVVPHQRDVNEALEPHVSEATWQDIGRGQILVTVKGANFDPSSSIALGDTQLTGPGSGLNVLSDDQLLFVAPAQKLATARTVIAGPNGAAAIGDRVTDEGNSSGHNRFHLHSLDPAVINLDDKAKLVRLTVTYNGTLDQPLVARIGNSVYGLSDAPFRSYVESKGVNGTDSSVTLTFAAPIQAVEDAETVVVQDLVGRNPGESISSRLTSKDAFTASSAVVLTSTDDSLKLGIIGTRFAPKPTVLIGGVKQHRVKVYPPDGTGTLITVDVEMAAIKGAKSVVVMQGNATPVVLPLNPPQPDAPKPKVLDPPLPATINQGSSKTMRLRGVNIHSIKQVTFEQTVIAFSFPKEDDTAIDIKVTTPVTALVGSKELTLTLTDGTTTTYTIEVIAPK